MAEDWSVFAPLTRQQVVELFDTGETRLRDRDGRELPTLRLAPELVTGDPKAWKEIVLAVARRTPEASL